MGPLVPSGCGDEEVPWGGLRCSGQPHFLQAQHLHAAGGRQEDLRRPPRQAQGPLRGVDNPLPVT